MNVLKLAALAGALSVAAAPALAQNQLSIATGGTSGTYFPLGGGIAELITNNLDGYSASAEVTGASVENIAYIHSGDADIAFSLGDSAYQAYTGTGAFEGRQVDVVALGALYSNAVQIFVAADSPIQSLSDLVGTRVSVGAPGSGTEVNAQALLSGNGIAYSDLAAAQRFNYSESADAVRDGIIDASILSGGVPNGAIMSLAVSRPLRLIPLTDEEVALAQEADPVFAPYTIPGGTYEGVADDIASIGIPNVLVVHGEMDDDLAYELTKLVFEEVEYLRSIHPAAIDTTVEFSLSSSPIPLHPGSIRYYEEVGATIPDHLRP